MKLLYIIVLIIASQLPCFARVYFNYSPASSILIPNGLHYAISRPESGNMFRLDITGPSGRWLIAYERQAISWRNEFQNGYTITKNDFISLNYSIDFSNNFYLAPGFTLNLRDKPSDLGLSALAGWRYNLNPFIFSPEIRYLRLLNDRMDLLTFSFGIGVKLFNW